jgi:uncharacterized protein DUF2569
MKETEPDDYEFLCSGCGANVTEEDKVCPVCGRDTNEIIEHPETVGPRTPSGIGGWLILPAIGLVLSPLIIIGGLLVAFKIWTESIGALELDYPGAYVAITAQLIMGGAFLCFFLYVAARFFTKKKSVPTLMIALLVINLVLAVITNVLYASVFRESADIKEITRAILLCAVWIPYFRLSKRVKATFVN